MDPNNQPWTPRPYEPPTPQQLTPPEPDLTVQLHHDAPTWQPPQPTLETSPPPVPSSAAPHQPDPALSLANAQLQQPVQSWAQPQPQPAQHQPSTQFGNVQSFGGPMAELPPLAAHDQFNTPTAGDKKQRLIMWIVIAVVVILPALIIGTLFLTKQLHDASQKKAALAQPPISYNASALQQLAANPTAGAVGQLNKESTFYTVLKQAATQSVVQTKWDSYYTNQQGGARGDQYTFYDTAIDYGTKAYAYSEDSYSNLGLFQTRCIGTKQYNFNGSALLAAPGWAAASDSTDCGLNTVTMHLNDGFNAGGLTSGQADTFLNALHKSGVVKVDAVSLVANGTAQYLKLDADVIPQDMGNGIYWGMQKVMTAFQSTGLNAAKQPYTFFGASGEGAHITYYVDLSTQLPVYGVMNSTPSFDKFGKPQVTTSWSHRFIEYTFPKTITAPTLNDNTPISFAHWSDH